MKVPKLIRSVILEIVALVIAFSLSQCSKDIPVDEDDDPEYIFEGGEILEVHVGGYLITQRNVNSFHHP
jgi:hypothetical protein